MKLETNEHKTIVTKRTRTNYRRDEQIRKIIKKQIYKKQKKGHKNFTNKKHVPRLHERNQGMPSAAPRPATITEC